MRSLLAALILALSFGGALAQQSSIAPPPVTAIPREAAVPDVPPGFPYYTGHEAGGGAQVADSGSQVPLRDYLSSRIDQLRNELIDRIVLLDSQQRRVLDERDRQYVQRFDAQQAAVQAALAAAKEAVGKAEDAANKRFDSVNEFRGQLNDQSKTLMSKAEADARFKSIEEKIETSQAAIAQLDNRIVQLTSTITATKAGGDDTWKNISLGLGIILALGGVAALFWPRHTRPTR